MHHDLVDRALELIHDMGLTPADLLRRQQERIASPRVRANEDKYKYNHFIELDSEEVPDLAREAIEEVAGRDARIRAAGAKKLWRDFRHFNLLKGRTRIGVKALLGFLRVWEDRLSRVSIPSTGGRRPAPPVEAAPLSREEFENQRQLSELASPAPCRNRAWHKSDLTSRIGATGYRGRVREIIESFGCSRFMAELAVHGMAVTTGEISP